MTEEIFAEIVLKNMVNIQKDYFVIYGTGKVADVYYNYISEKFGEEYICFFINGKKDCNEYMGKKVYSPEQLKTKSIDISRYKYIVGTLSKIPLFTQKLVEIGVSEDNIIEPVYNFSCDYMNSALNEINKIIFYPEFKDENEMNKIIKTVNSNIVLAPQSNKKIIFVSSKKSNTTLKNEYKILDKFPELDDKTLVLVWKAEHILDSRIKDLSNVYCCEGSFISNLFPRMLTIINNKIIPMRIKEEFRTISLRNYTNLIDKHKEKKWITICGLGPSFNEKLSQYREMIEDGIIVTCNSFYKIDIDLIPDIYVLKDHQYLENCVEDLDAVIQYIKRNKVFLIVNETWLPILLSNYSGIDNLIIGLRLDDEKLNIVSIDNMAIKNLYNVVPGMCVPIASGLKDTIYILGCDGGNREREHVSWQYSYKTEENGKDLQEELGVYMNFGEISTYKDYYYEVNNMYKEIFEYGEKLKKIYISLTHSNFEEIEIRNIDNNGM